MAAINNTFLALEADKKETLIIFFSSLMLFDFTKAAKSSFLFLLTSFHKRLISLLGKSTIRGTLVDFAYQMNQAGI